MRNFDYSTLASMSWDSEIIGLVAQIHEYKGRQELYLKQKPAELDRLIEVAKVQSTEASNEIESIIVLYSHLRRWIKRIFHTCTKPNLCSVFYGISPVLENIVLYHKR